MSVYDMAIGIGRMLNIDLPLNFNSPYKSLTITEFWERWHITLTRFFTRYIYIPLGGSRKGNNRTYINTMIVFLISGLWHGANWTFILWGLVHGIFSVATKYKKDFFEQLHPALNWIITFSFINIMWIFFRANSIRDAFTILKSIAVLNFGPIDRNINDCFKLDELVFLLKLLPGRNLLSVLPYFLLLLFFSLAFYILLGKKNDYQLMLEFRPEIKNSFLTVILLVWSIVSFSGISTFLYFNF